jgi:hypothetical protein
MKIQNESVNRKLNFLIDESASFIRRYIDELQGHKVRQTALEKIADGVEGLTTPGEVYRPFSKFSPAEPIAKAGGHSSELLIKGRQ